MSEIDCETIVNRKGERIAVAATPRYGKSLNTLKEVVNTNNGLIEEVATLENELSYIKEAINTLKTHYLLTKKRGISIYDERLKGLEDLEKQIELIRLREESL